jgi:hypothetical protein
MKPYFLLAASLAVLAGSAAAQMPSLDGGHGGFGLLQFDANADGRLTKAEFEAGQRTRFNVLDGNKDGSATPEEIAAGREVEGKAQRESMLKSRFTELDRDRNGQLSQAEFLATVEARGDRGAGMRGGPGPGPRIMGRRGPGDPGSGPGNRPAFAGRADADRDGKLTFVEFIARGTEAFDRADANKDGVITITELQAARPAAR